MGVHDRSDDRQAQTRAARGACTGRVPPVEALECLGGDLGIHPRTLVGDRQDGRAVVAAQRDVRRCSRRRVHARVLQQVVDDLAQASGVARDDRGSVEVGVEDAVGVDRTGRVDRVRDDRREVDRLALERSALVEPSEQQEVVDEHAHALRLRFDARHRPGEVVGPRVGAAAEQLRVPPDRRDRRPQLVRGVADEPPQALLRGAALVERRFDLGQHRVERGAELADLSVVVGGLHPARQVPGRDRAGGLAHRLERPQPDLHEHECERAGDERDPDRDQRFDREQASERGAHLGERHRDHEGSGARARPHRLDPEAAAPARGARGERHRADAAGRRPGEAGGQHGDAGRCPGGTRTSGSARRCPTHRAAPRSSRSGLRPKPAAARRASGILLPVRAP